MASLSEQVDEWLASCSSSSPLKVKREDDGGHAASSVTLMLEADGAEDGAPRPVVQVMLQAGRVTLMCVDEDDQYEGFNTAAAQFCAKGCTVATALDHMVELFSAPEALEVLMEAEGNSSDESGSSDSESDYSYGSDAADATISVAPPPIPLGAQRSYVVMDMERLQARLREQIAQAQRVLRISASSACVLLRHCKWDVDELVRRWHEDRAAVAEEAGAQLERDIVSEAGEADEEEEECEICMEPLESSCSIGCNHKFCSECWTEYLLSAVYGPDGGTQSVCPGDECTNKLGEDVFRFFLQSHQPEAWRKYQQALLNSFVQDSSNICWCPAPGCTRVVAYSTRRRTVKCDCGRNFCFECKDEPHAPITCKQKEGWDDCAAKRGKQRPKKIKLTNVKPCPSCGFPTEKNGGCMYMSCTSCRQPWCWQCGDFGPNVHHVYDCNKPPSSKWDTGVDAVAADEGRFDFYYERFANHLDSRMLAQKQQANIADKLEPLLAVPEHKIIDVFQSAVELVVQCRFILTWSYPYAFFCTDETKRTLFEYAQAKLEEYTEKLSRLTELPLFEITTPSNQESMRTLTDALRQYARNMEEYEPLDVDLARFAGASLAHNVRGAAAPVGGGPAAGAGAGAGAGGAGGAKVATNQAKAGAALPDKAPPRAIPGRGRRPMARGKPRKRGAKRRQDAAAADLGALVLDDAAAARDPAKQGVGRRRGRPKQARR